MTTPNYLTLVFKITGPEQRRDLLKGLAENWCAASNVNAIATRDAALSHAERLQALCDVHNRKVAELSLTVHKLEARMQTTQADTLRLDWLADKDNPIGNVELPTHIVQNNPHSLRAAIDASMEIGKGIQRSS